MIDHNHFICHFIFGGHLLNIPPIAEIIKNRNRVKDCFTRGGPFFGNILTSKSDDWME